VKQTLKSNGLKILGHRDQIKQYFKISILFYQLPIKHYTFNNDNVFEMMNWKTAVVPMFEILPYTTRLLLLGNMLGENIFYNKYSLMNYVIIIYIQ